jgi:hypothetical protein
MLFNDALSFENVYEKVDRALMGHFKVISRMPVKLRHNLEHLRFDLDLNQIILAVSVTSLGYLPVQ